MKISVVALTAIGTVLAFSAAQAHDRTLVIGSYGGSVETLMKEQIFPPFEEAHDVDIQYVSGNSTENLARLQAQRDNQEMDVVFLDDGPMYQADALGFCSPLQDAPIYDHVYDSALMSPNTIGLGYVATGIVYNADWFASEGWDAPTSWQDITDDKFSDILSIPPITNTYGLHALIMMARLNGGGESDIDPGFQVMADQVAPNVLVFEPSSGRMSELFQSEEIALSVWGSGRAKALADSGFPVKFVFPSEGAPALLMAACPIAGSDQEDLANQFLQYMLTPEIQVDMAEAIANGPVVDNAVLTDEQAAFVPYGQDEINSLITVDWNTINAHREEWTARWAREIER